MPVLQAGPPVISRGLALPAVAARGLPAAAGPAPFTNGANTTVTDAGGGWWRVTKTGGVEGAADAFAYATDGFPAGYTCRFRWPNIEPDQELSLWITKDDPPTLTLEASKTALMRDGLSYGDGVAEFTRENGVTIALEPGNELVAISGTGAMANWSIDGNALSGSDNTNGTTPSRPGATIKTLGAFIEIKLS